MDMKELFAKAEFENIGNDLDNPYTFPYFLVPAGYWYMTDEDAQPKRAGEDMTIYMCGRNRFLKMLDPGKAPIIGICYYWFSSEED